MNQPASKIDPRTFAHVEPLAIFMIALLPLDILKAIGFVVQDDAAAWYRTAPEQWLYPLQTVVTLVMLWRVRQSISFGPHRGWLLAVVAGIVGIIFWIAPGYLYLHFGIRSESLRHLGFLSRTEGFDPSFISSHSAALYWMAVSLRFLRMVVVVAVAEEIFWRGFLMRLVVDPDGDFWQVPFGTHRWKSFLIVTTAFTLVHSPADYAAAFVYGALTYGVAVHTKSLSACILMHATANLLLGCYVMQSQQWGYW